MALKSENNYLLDTSVWISVMRRHEPERKIFVQAGFDNISIGYSVITEAELWAGILPTGLRTEQEHKIVLAPFKRYFVNVSIARRAGNMLATLRSQGFKDNQLPELADCIIAATAEYHQLIVWTNNSSHFSVLSQQFNVPYIKSTDIQD